MSNYKTFLIIFFILGLQVFRFFEPLGNKMKLLMQDLA